MKNCSKCKKTKADSEYYRHQDGCLYASCKECMRKYNNINSNPGTTGMTDEEIEAWNKAHPIQRNRIREGLLAAMARINGERSSIENQMQELHHV